MKIAVFLNGLGFGGTEKAACRWARGLKVRGHEVVVLSLEDGSRRTELKSAGIPVQILESDAAHIASALRTVAPKIIHAHVPGEPSRGDLLGEALTRLPQKIPVVQTNVFGRLNNPRENAWTDFRLFVSWTGAVQAARRHFLELSEHFFSRMSVAVNPLDADDGPDEWLVKKFRAAHGILEEDIVFGHLGRPDMIRWDMVPITAFQQALNQNRRLKLLLREPPAEIARKLASSPMAERCVVLPVTTDPEELRLTTAAMDVVLHYSKVGESFGYGIAEPMNLGKPAIVNSTPWDGQAQIELVRHGECGFVASTSAAMAKAIQLLAADDTRRREMGAKARQHIRALTNPDHSTSRLEAIFHAAIEKHDNPFAAEDLKQAIQTAAYLDTHQFGHSWSEQLALRPFHYRVRFHELRKSLKNRSSK